MNKNDYKRAIGQIRPDTELESKLRNRLVKERKSAMRKPVAYTAAACAALILGAGIVFNPFNADKEAANKVTATPPATSLTATNTPAAEGIRLPEIKLPTTTYQTLANMMPLFVYKGKVYTQAATTITPEAGKLLLGEKLGTTKSGINEWSSQNDYATEFASTIGETDVYAVKGYDSDFRLMTYQVIDGQPYAELFENVNGFTVNSGADLLGQLRLEGNIASAQWEKFDSWNNGLQQYTKVTDLSPLTPFLSVLNAAKPLEGQPLSDAGIYDDPNQAFLTLTLKDGSAVQLRLFQKGYVKYGHADVFFQVDSAVFADLWSQADAAKQLME